MKDTFLLWKQMKKEHWKRTVSKPLTYIVLGFVFFQIINSYLFGNEMGLDRGEEFVEMWLSTLSAGSFLFLLPRFILYSRRIVLRREDYDFLKKTPLEQKQLLLFLVMRSQNVLIVFYLYLFMTGVNWCNISALKLALFLLPVCIMEKLLEISCVILFYGSKKITQRRAALIRRVLYIVLGGFIAILLYLNLTESGSYAVSVELFLGAIQIIPIFGWFVGAAQLVFMGPTVLNVITASLYIGLTASLGYLAVRQKCSGSYYENLMLFVEEHPEFGEKNIPWSMSLQIQDEDE